MDATLLCNQCHATIEREFWFAYGLCADCYAVPGQTRKKKAHDGHAMGKE